jgi:acetate kinase
MAVLNRTDALIFTGGIGENSFLVRKKSCSGLDNLGILLNDRKNESISGKVYEIQHDRAAVKVIVIATDEEFEIARQSVETIKAVLHKE